MTTYNFTFYITKPSFSYAEAADRLYKAGATDCTYSFINGQHQISFSREANNLLDAAKSAEESIAKADIGAFISDIKVDFEE